MPDRRHLEWVNDNPRARLDSCGRIAEKLTNDKHRKRILYRRQQHAKNTN